MVDLTAGVTHLLMPAMAMLLTPPILMVPMDLAEALAVAEDLAGAEVLAEEDGGKSC